MKRILVLVLWMVIAWHSTGYQTLGPFWHWVPLANGSGPVTGNQGYNPALWLMRWR